ncbi:MAG TPA: ABC transporter ATP-binding protein, partial [Bacteroidia bacterium]|nr:ABC transporter ATP-binding protein [Bacteroidia bacterium]
FGVESFFEWLLDFGFKRLAQRVQHDLRIHAYDHLQHREMAYFEKHRMGDTLAILSDDVNQLERFLNTGFNEILQLVVLFVFSGIILFTTSWQLALVGMVPIPFILWGSRHYQKLVGPRYGKMRDEAGLLGSRMENNLSGIAVIKSFSAEDYERERVAANSEAYREANFLAIKLSAVYVPLIRMLVAVGFGGTLLLGSYWVLNDSGMITVGELVLFSMMIQRLLWPITRLGATLDSYERAKASAKRIFGLLDVFPTIQDHPKSVSMDRASGSISFENVHFDYGNDVPVLQGLDFEVQAGETIGIAGTTGSGKSTMIKLLLRFYDVTEGHIRMDGQDLRDLKLKDLRRNIALVSQDVYLFHGTIAENIAYGLQGAGEAAIVEAAKAAQLHDFVVSLPEGYQSIVGERGIKLSGGQRQRLSIARAILKNAPVLVLDEATSSVDTETERAIQENLAKYAKDRTAIVVAHRLSTIRQANRILVIDQGRVAEHGTHDELILQGGIYAELWKVQTGLSTVS